MSSQAKSTRKDTASANIVPFAAPLLMGAAKVGDAAQGAVLWGVKKYGISGSGKPIADLWGIAADKAARAYVGNGPLKAGGRGIEGGNAKLALVGKVPVVVTVAVLVGAAVLNQRHIAVQPEQSAPETNTCENCQGALTDASGDGDNPHASAACPHCGHESTSQA